MSAQNHHVIISIHCLVVPDDLNQNSSSEQNPFRVVSLQSENAFYHMAKELITFFPKMRLTTVTSQHFPSQRPSSLYVTAPSWWSLQADQTISTTYTQPIEGNEWTRFEQGRLCADFTKETFKHACYIPSSWKKRDKKCAIIYTVAKEPLHYAWEPMSSV